MLEIDNSMDNLQGKRNKLTLHNILKTILIIPNPPFFWPPRTSILAVCTVVKLGQAQVKVIDACGGKYTCVGFPWEWSKPVVNIEVDCLAEMTKQC